MLSYALMFLVIALIAGLFGFGLVAGMSYGAAKIFFFLPDPGRRLAALGSSCERVTEG